MRGVSKRALSPDISERETIAGLFRHPCLFTNSKMPTSDLFCVVSFALESIQLEGRAT